MGRKGTDLMQAAEYIDQILKRDRHLEKVAEALKRLGSLEGAESETQERLEGLRAQIAEAEGELARATEAADNARDNARDEAQRLLDQASAEADEIVRQAQDKAQAEARRLDEHLEQRRREMERQEAEAGRRAQQIVAEAEGWHQEANTKVVEVDQARTELAGLNDKITRAREAAKRLLED